MECWNNGKIEECLPCEMRRRSYFYGGKTESLSSYIMLNWLNMLGQQESLFYIRYLLFEW